MNSNGSTRPGLRHDTPETRSSNLASLRNRALETLQHTCDRRRRGELESLIADLDARLSATKDRG